MCAINCSGGCPECAPQDHTLARNYLLTINGDGSDDGPIRLRVTEDGDLMVHTYIDGGFRWVTVPQEPA